TVSLEIRQDQLFIVSEQHQGLGGFPLGCQDAVLSLISGGFDSSVSSYLCIKRGLQTHYCFFNLGGKAHELAVKEVALFLWMKYHSSHRVKFISVPFEAVVAEILNRVDNSLMGVVLKRMMLRVADKIAKQMQISALVTGESVGQVSSQTLVNLAVIDTVAESLVLRPLCTVNKQEIIDIARNIGSEEFSRNIPEYCAVISRNPSTRAKLERVEYEETRFDFSVLDAAVKNARHQLITELAEDFDQKAVEVKIVSEIGPEHTIIDIRHPTELEARPLILSQSTAPAEVLSIPFYQLRTSFTMLDKRKSFLLFCDKGMMSRLHAAHLLDEGFVNVAVLDLSASGAGTQ
ncbi:MAG: tRNA 4-thiouridine(8) synthase ThiI, partial [Proteobacteria bacterium]|nr:tRNA 4-thiouridine(8) synthase ThiI [Pseudomonadota bacterium]